MTSAPLSSSRLERPPVERRPEDRWIAPNARIGKFSLGMAIVLLASLALHAVIMATAVFDGSRVALPPQEIAVEIIQEKPVDKPKPTEKPAPEPSKPEAAKQAEQAAPEAAKPEPKLEAKPPEPPVLKPALAETKPAPQAPDDKAAQEKVAALEKEFASLKAERAALEAQRAADAATETKAAAPPPRAETGLGPLPDSFQAIALPATTNGVGGEVMGYQEIVFSQLAKANELGKTQGLPGSTGVHFTIDETGALVSVEIVHPSGIASLDERALVIVHKAAPFPLPPQGALRSFDANVNFVADGAR